jgi:hypothetical protein
MNKGLLACFALAFFYTPGKASAQFNDARAYDNTLVGVSQLELSYTYARSNVSLDPSLAIAGANLNLNQGTIRTVEARKWHSCLNPNQAMKHTSIHRWAFKPELGYSRRWGNWLLDGYGGVWLYTTNDAFFSMPNPQPQTEQPIGSFEGHLSYDFSKQRCWVSLDGNFWFGGGTSLNGVSHPGTRQTSSRIGGTAAFPLSKHQTIKMSYSDGTYVRFGGNYQNVSVAGQYSWRR